MKIKGPSLMGVAFLLIIGTGLAHGQTQDSYRGFRIGMALSETFAVGGGNLEKAQAACASPPKQLSSQERELLARVCPKIERTLSGQPTEWEFPKEKIRIAFDGGHIIRVSDFDGEIHLQGTQPQIAASVSSPVPPIPGPIPVQQPTTSSTPLPNQDQDVAAAAAANKAAKAKAAAQQGQLTPTPATVVAPVETPVAAQVATPAQAITPDTTPAPTSNDRPIKLVGHTIGEVVGLNCPPDKNVEKSHHMNKQDVQRWVTACETGSWTDRIDTRTHENGTRDWVEGGLTYKSKTLVKMDLVLNYNNYAGPAPSAIITLAEVKKKLGEFTDTSSTPMRNGYGATWTNSIYIWDLPSGYVELYLDGNPESGVYGLLKAMSHKEHVADTAKQAARKGSLD